MFTGLIKKTGILLQLERVGDAARLKISHSPWDEPLEHGESLAVQGICLTVTSSDTKETCFDVLHETLERTTLGRIRNGDRLNLERALMLKDRIGGHLVTGHIDGQGTVRDIHQRNRDWLVTIVPDKDMAGRIVMKGSIAIDGVSLTVAAVNEESFDVHIIPFTWENTSLSSLYPGTTTNLELDIIGKYVESYMKLYQNNPLAITPELLDKCGFIR